MKTAKLPVAIVDDDASVSTFMMEMLRDWGYTVAMFDGPDALTRARKTQRFLAVVLDLAMPDMDAFEMLNTLPDDNSMEPVVIASSMPAAVIAAAHTICTAKGIQVLGAFSKPLQQGDLNQIRQSLSQL